MYEIAELVRASAKIFGGKYTGALVEAALKQAGRKAFELDEAVRIVEEFAQREVSR